MNSAPEHRPPCHQASPTAPGGLAQRTALWWLTALLLAVPVAALFLGVVDLPASDIVALLSGKGSAEARSIIVNIRLPRMLTGALAGIHLAVAGLILQRMTANPLADPSLIGISQGASCAASIFLLLSVFIHHLGSGILPLLPLAWLPTVATLGGLASAGLVYLLAVRQQLGIWPLTLCGIAVGTSLQALAIGLMAAWGTTRMDVLLQWLSGSLYGRSWEHVCYLLPYSLGCFMWLFLLRRPLALLSLQPDSATSFGLAYSRHFSLLLILAAIFAASAVGTVGPVVFIGLVVPHMADFFTRHNPRLLLPLCMILGALMMISSDLCGRLIGQAAEIPVGVVTIIIGVPVLAFMLRRTPGS